MKSYLQELSNSLRNNKLRTALTGFSIAWGIIILVVMLGAGKGVENGIKGMVFSTGAGQVVIKADLGMTKLPYAGYQEGRLLYLTPNQLSYVQDVLHDRASVIEASYSVFTEGSTIYGTSVFKLSTISYEEQQFNTLERISGRLFSSSEHKDGDRVIVISDGCVTQLFGKKHNPLGQYLELDGLNYRIIGVIKAPNPFFGIAYIPLNTHTNLYPNSVLKVPGIKIYPRDKSIVKIRALQSDLEAILKQMLKVDPKDMSAVKIESSADQADAMDKIFKGLQIMLWIMGIGSLSIGTVGVSNIMHVTVQERMREIGIRKSIGAKPKDIITLVLGESLLLSVSAGIIGLLIGVLLVRLLNYMAIVNHWGQQVMPTGVTGETITLKLFDNPEVNIGVAFGALIILIIAGLIAGFGPSRKAIRVPAIVAMRDLK